MKRIWICILCLCCLSALGLNALAEEVQEEIDLTQMSSNMVYAYVYSMMSAPDDFIGQRFKLRGTYDEEYWDVTDLTYHYAVIADATSCCAQGLEFLLEDGEAEYPQVGDEIEISGLFETYEEEGLWYIRIRADRMEVLA